MDREQVIEKIAYELWADKILPKPSFKDWQTQIWVEKKEEQQGLRKLAVQLLALKDSEGNPLLLVRDHDQSMPSSPHRNPVDAQIIFNYGYERAQQDMLAQGWVKII